MVDRFGLSIDEYNKLYELFYSIKKTSSIKDPKDNSISFIRNEKFISWLDGKELSNFYLLVNHDFPIHKLNIRANVYKLSKHHDVDFIFTSFHNLLHEFTKPLDNIIGSNCQIHETVLMDLNGAKYITNPYTNTRFLMKHIGNVHIGDSVYIDAYTTIHRSCMSSTRIGNNVKIFSHTNIGHNCEIGDDSQIGPGAFIAGGAIIGKRCTIWQGASVRNNIKICDDVTIGMGSVVTKDINEPGLYYSNTYLKKIR